MNNKPEELAFPSEYAPGMSLRDWFAGQALPALIAQHAPRVGDEGERVALVCHAYDIADDMLQRRAT